jgi:uncharacterized membrane protein YedE/YeeE
MSYWPWWVGGFALAAVLVGHWAVTRRMMAVSGRYSALVDRLRFGKQEDESAEMSDAELIAAMRELTLAHFGPAAIEEAQVQTASAPVERVAPPPLGVHLVFLGGLILGGAIAAVASGSFGWTATLRGDGFAALTGGSSILTLIVLFGGGALVGAGARMAGGCTSGHGLCGTSRLQSGSIAATFSFFGAGVLTSLLIGSLF